MIGFWITSISVRASPTISIHLIHRPMKVATGAITAHFPPKQPAIIPTADRFLSSLIKTRCTYVFSVPSFLEVRVPFLSSGLARNSFVL